MKDKILIFIIGLLVGAIIATTGLLIYERNFNSNQMPGGERMQMMERPDGENPPEKPSGNGNNENKSEVPQKPETSANNKSN